MLIFGNQWEGSVSAFHFLSVSVFFQIVGGLSGSIYQVVNKTKQMFWAGIVGTIITVAAIIVGIRSGKIEMLALCCSIGFIINFIKSQWFLGHFCFDTSVFSLLRIYIPEAVCLLLMCLVMPFVPDLSNIFFSFILKFTVCTVLYIILLYLTKDYKFIINLLPNSIKSGLPHFLKNE